MGDSFTRRETGQGVFVFGVLILSIMVPITLATSSPSLTEPAVLAIAIIAITGARFSSLIAKGEPRLMELSTWTFTYVFFGLAPLVQLQKNKWPETAPYIYREYLEPAMWATFASISVAMLFAVTRGSGKSDPPEPGPTSVVVHEGRAVLLALIALVLNAYFLTAVGPASLLLSRQDLRAIEFAIWPDIGIAVLIIGACTMPLLVAFVALLQASRQRRARGAPGYRVLSVTVCFAVLYSVNPISSPRYYFGTVILTVAAALGAYATPRRVRNSAISFLLVLFLVFPIADMFRRSTQVDAIAFRPLDSLTTGDFDGLVQMTNAMRYVDLEGITWGEQAIGVLLFWVPRSLWAGKPTDSAGLIAEYAGYDFTNMSAPLWAEMLLNGGWPLMILGMALFGWWIRGRDERGVELWRRGGATTPLTMILPFYLIILIRGSLLHAMVYLAIIALCARYVTVGRRAIPRDTAKVSRRDRSRR